MHTRPGVSATSTAQAGQPRLSMTHVYPTPDQTLALTLDRSAPLQSSSHSATSSPLPSAPTMVGFSGGSEYHRSGSIDSELAACSDKEDRSLLVTIRNSLGDIAALAWEPPVADPLAGHLHHHSEFDGGGASSGSSCPEFTPSPQPASVVERIPSRRFRRPGSMYPRCWGPSPHDVNLGV